MSKVLVDRPLLERIARDDEGAASFADFEELKRVLAQTAEAEGAGALDELLALFPLKIDKQAFVVNGGKPLAADGDDEFLSFKKVNAALGQIRQLAEQALAALSAVAAERDRLQDQVKVLQSDASSWQSGYDKGRRDGTKHRQSEVDQLRAEVEALRATVATQTGEL